MLVNKQYKKQALALFLFLTVGSAFSNAYALVASLGEQIIAFVSALITYAVIVSLFLTFVGSDVLAGKVRKYIAVSFVLMTIIENVYPMILYYEQTLPSNYLFLFSIQLLVNGFMAKVISHERSA